MTFNAHRRSSAPFVGPLLDDSADDASESTLLEIKGHALADVVTDPEASLQRFANALLTGTAPTDRPAPVGFGDDDEYDDELEDEEDDDFDDDFDDEDDFDEDDDDFDDEDDFDEDDEDEDEFLDDE